ncbi:MAG: metal ABC transporter substrate-binding protein, partial [Oscillospiraceae bacterium]|nr:metal ABC transporter substrate-binding protein [Oscillospiraceae bacterium]
MIKRLFALLLGLSLVATSAGCAQKTATGSAGIQVVCATAPLYDWTRQITKGTTSTEQKLIIGKGTDLHSFQPSAADIIAIKNADVLIYVGGESDGWIRDALKETLNKNQKVVCLMDALKDSIVEEEVVEGMQDEDKHDHKDHDHEEGPEYDEHVWMSLRLAAKSCKAIEEAIASVAKADASKFKANLDEYLSKLDALDKQYEEMVKGARLDTMVVADRYPFRYLAEDYKLKYSAAFVGCSAETEASFETVKFLADKIKALDSKTILTIENSDGKIAKTIIETSGKTDVKIEALDSMQSCGDELDYLSVMTGNL